MRRRGVLAQRQTNTQALHTVLASVVVLAIATFLLWGRTVPVVSADEIGYLADAQLLAHGTLLNMGYTRFYFGGYPLALVPLNGLFQDPRSFYQAAVLLNAVFLAGTVPVLVRLAHDFGFARTALTPWLAAVLTFWPSQLFQAYLALPEIALRLIMLLLVGAAFALVRAGGLRQAVLVALLAVLAYAFHPRAMVVLPLALLLLVVAAMARRSAGWLALSVGAAIIVAGYGAVGWLNAFLQSSLWLYQHTAAADVAALARRVLEQPMEMALRSFGHGWYQVIATLLLVPFGSIVVITWALGTGPPDRRAVSTFVLLVTLGIGAAGSSNMIWPDTIDWLVYSRFLDVITPVLAWIGILSISRQEWRATFAPWLPWLVAGGLSGGMLLYLRYAHLGMRAPNPVEIGSFAPLVRLTWLGPDMMARTMLFVPLVLMAIAVAAYFAARREAWLLAALTLFCLLTTVDITAYYRSANFRGENRIASAAEAFGKVGDVPIHQDRSARVGEPYIQQFMLGRYFPPLDVATEIPQSGTVAIVGRRLLMNLRGECVATLPQDLALVRFGGPNPVVCPNAE